MTNELYHHGVIGQKWGIRRYQNYDGTYTQKGMQHYRASKANYDAAKIAKKEAKADYKRASAANNKSQSAKAHYKQTKLDYKQAKREMALDYKQLKRDKKADKGKALYASGHTITGNAETAQVAGLIASGTATAAGLLRNYGKTKESNYVAAAGIGLEFVTGVIAVKNARQDRLLRAYYGHSRIKTRGHA